MKKTTWALTLLVLVLVLGLASFMAACGEEEPATTTAPPATTGTTAATATTVAPTTTEAPTTTTEAGVPDTGQTWNLKFSYGVPTRASLYAAQLEPWAKAVEQATGGRVKIEHYADGTLAKDEQQYDFLLSGASDISVVEPEYSPGIFPVFEVGSLPRLFPDPAVASAVMWDVAQKYPDEFGEVKLLGITCISGAQYVGNVPVKVPADLKGVKMRSGGKIESWILNAIGAEPIDITLGDLGTSMERGLADGAFLSWSMVFVSGAKDYTKDRTVLDLMYRPWFIVMNQDVWDSMPVKIQEAVQSVSGQIPSVIYSVANEEVTQGDRATLEMLGGKTGLPPIYVPTAEEMALWNEAVKPTWQMWTDELSKSKSPYAANGQEILDFIAGKVAEYKSYYADYKDEAQPILDAMPKEE